MTALAVEFIPVLLLCLKPLIVFCFMNNNVKPRGMAAFSSDVQDEFSHRGDEIDEKVRKSTELLTIVLSSIFGIIVLICLALLFCCWRGIGCFNKQRQVDDWDDIWDGMGSRPEPVIGSNSHYEEVMVEAEPEPEAIPSTSKTAQGVKNTEAKAEPESQTILITGNERAPEKVHRRSSGASKLSKASHRSKTRRSKSTRPRRSS